MSTMTTRRVNYLVVGMPSFKLDLERQSKGSELGKTKKRVEVQQLAEEDRFSFSKNPSL